MDIKPETFDFLKKIKKNNNREWFNDHKSLYTESHENMISFADHLIAEMNKHDEIETASGKKSLFRIYRDVRFSKDKSPYKTSWSGGLKRATNQKRGGYYFHVEPGNSLIAGGFWGPSSDDLRHIREHIAQDDEQLRDILNDKSFKKVFGQLEGEALKTAPKGFPKDHPAIDLLQKKQFLLTHRFTDEEVLQADFPKKAVNGFLALRPFFDYMSEILTTNLNGELI